MHLVDHGGLILGIARVDFHPDRTTLVIANEPDDNLLTAFLAIAVIAKGDQFAVFVVAFKIDAGDIVEDHLSIAQMTPGKGFLNGLLAL